LDGDAPRALAPRRMFVEPFLDVHGLSCPTDTAP
jgi:hypothetical protein